MVTEVKSSSYFLLGSIDKDSQALGAFWELKTLYILNRMVTTQIYTCIKINLATYKLYTLCKLYLKIVIKIRGG